MDALQVTPGSFSVWGGPAKRSGHLETELQGLFPDYDEVRNGEQTSLTKQSAENFVSPDGQWHVLHNALNVSGVDTTEPEI